MKKLLVTLLAVMMICSTLMVAYAKPNEVIDVPQFTTAPKLDGVITEAEWGKPTVHVVDEQPTTQFCEETEITEPVANLWFDLWIRWDATYYYIGIVSPDNTHALAAGEVNLWDGDAVQMGFDPKGPNFTGDIASPWSEDYTNMAFGLVSGEGNILTSWAWYGPMAGGQVEGAKYNIKRANNATTYEIAIPWESLGLENGVKAGDVYGAVIGRVFADNEEDGCNGFITWGTGVFGPVPEEDMCGSNGIRLSATDALNAATPSTGTAAPATADPFAISAVVMAVSAGAALVISKKRR